MIMRFIGDILTLISVIIFFCAIWLIVGALLAPLWVFIRLCYGF
jgi:hypothetical protein